MTRENEIFERKTSLPWKNRESFSRASVAFSVATFSQFSQSSQTPSNSLQNLTNEELVAKVKEMEMKHARTKTETEILARFLDENDPEPLEEHSVSRRASEAVSVLGKRASFAKYVPRRVSFGSFHGPLVTQEAPRINILYKSEMVYKEMEELQKNNEKLNRRTQLLKLLYSSQIEEIENRIRELEESLVQFTKLRDIDVPHSMDKFARFMDEWSKKSRMDTDKCRMRYSSLRTQLQKLLQILAYKKLIGENLQKIDFEQLRIENVHLAIAAEQKTRLLFELKKMTAAGSLKLSQQKKILLKKIAEKAELLKAVKDMEASIANLDDDTMSMYETVAKLKANYDKLKAKVTSYRAPEIMEYVNSKIKIFNLEKELEVWQRRKDIKNTSLHFDIKRMQKMLQCKKAHPCWFECPPLENELYS